MPGDSLPEQSYNLITAQVYEAMWEVYKNGNRTQGELAHRFGIHIRTAKRAIHRGWAARGFMALKERAQEHDRLKIEAERQAALDAFKERTDAWYKAGKQFNRVADQVVVFCIAATQQISNLTIVRSADGKVALRPLTKWVKKRSTETDAQGNRVVRMYDEEVPLTVQEGVKLQQSVLRAAGMASAFKRLWPQQTDEERAANGPPTGLAALTEDQLRHITETGELPPGISAEDVFGIDLPGIPQGKGNKRTN